MKKRHQGDPLLVYIKSIPASITETAAKTAAETPVGHAKTAAKTAARGMLMPLL